MGHIYLKLVIKTPDRRRWSPSGAIITEYAFPEFGTVTISCSKSFLSFKKDHFIANRISA